MILKNSLIIFLAASIGHLLNYFYHLISARYLNLNQYGLLESLLALNYFLAVIISSFSLSIIARVNHQNLKSLERLSYRLTLIVWLFFLASYPLFNRLLQINQPRLFLIFSLQLLFSFIPTFYLSLLQAKLHFKAFSLINLVSPLAKLSTLCLLLYLGLRLDAAIFGLLAGGLATVLVAYRLVKPLLNAKQLAAFSLRSFWSFSALSFITQLGLTSLYTTDIILVRWLFLPEISGIYSAVSLLGKIIFFVSATVLTVSFPLFVKQKYLKPTYLTTLGLIGLICLLGLGVYQFFPQLILRLLYPQPYQIAASLLPRFSLFIVLFTLLNLNLQFLLALGRPLAAWIAGFTAVLQISLIFLLHSSLNQIILNSIAAASLGLLFSSILVIKQINAKTR